MNVIQVIFLVHCVSFLIMFIIALNAPEFIQDKSGNWIPENPVTKT